MTEILVKYSYVCSPLLLISISLLYFGSCENLTTSLNHNDEPNDYKIYIYSIAQDISKDEPQLPTHQRCIKT